MEIYGSDFIRLNVDLEAIISLQQQLFRHQNIAEVQRGQTSWADSMKLLRNLRNGSWFEKRFILQHKTCKKAIIKMPGIYVHT